MSAITTIEQFVYGAESSFQSVLVDRSINFEREAGFAIQILTSGDYIAKLAAGDRQSVVNAVTNIAAIGILRKNGETVRTRDFLRIGVPFTLAAVLVGAGSLWLFWGI